MTDHPRDVGQLYALARSFDGGSDDALAAALSDALGGVPRTTAIELARATLRRILPALAATPRRPRRDEPLRAALADPLAAWPEPPPLAHDDLAERTFYDAVCALGQAEKPLDDPAWSITHVVVAVRGAIRARALHVWRWDSPEVAMRTEDELPSEPALRAHVTYPVILRREWTVVAEWLLARS
jgi:hypothetical protein